MEINPKEPLLNKDSDSENEETQVVIETKTTGEIIKEISRITLPAIVCQSCLILPNTINIWAAGQFNNSRKMDIVGLGMGITDAIGMAIFLGLNGALY